MPRTAETASFKVSGQIAMIAAGSQGLRGSVVQPHHDSYQGPESVLAILHGGECHQGRIPRTF